MKYIVRNEGIRERAIREIQSLHLNGRPWVVDIKPYHPKRSLEQNAYLHAVPLKLIAEHTGHSLEDMKDYLLMEAFGEEMTEVMGRNVIRPLKRTSDLTNTEFSWFIDWIASWAMNTLGLLIPMPNEEITDG